MALKKSHLIGIISGVLTIGVDLIFFLDDKNLFLFVLGIAVALIIFPFVFGVAAATKRELVLSEMFLEFSRNLAESVTTGTPISRSIINVSKKNYGPLSPYIQRLANQISLGIPVSQALQTFAHDVDNSVISRAVALISEAEKAGGSIDFILDSVAQSIADVEKLKQEQRASISNLVVQGYIIFFIFIGIMLIMEFKILPLTSGIGGFGGAGGSTLSGGFSETAPMASSVQLSAEALAKPFFYLLLTQGFFTGLTIGKLSEGSIKAGVRHSFILTVIALLVSTGARVVLS